MSMRPASRSSNQPLGTSGDWRRRLLLHYGPLALASATVLVLFMSLPRFDSSEYTMGDIFTGTFPRDFPEQGSTQLDGTGAHTGPPAGAEGHTGPPPANGANQAAPDEVDDRSFMRRLTTATGYVALGLLALTLLIGPANLLLQRRNPVSSYLRRDVGACAAFFSVVHLIPGLQVHGTGKLRDFLDYFIAPDGSALTNSLGLANWTGLAAVMIVVGLLALSSDFALRKFKAKTWKWLQRLNYALVALVIVHSFFYGALLRMTSPYTILLGLSVIAILAGQVVGIRLWRRRYSRVPGPASS